MCTASALCVIGTITNDHHFLDGTNVIGDTLKDIWTVPGLPRDYVKKAITPILYGSGQTPEELWDAHDYEHTQKQVNIINEELLDGRFKNALRFREFVIGNVKPAAKMTVDIWGEKFDIYCNKFKWDVTTPVRYSFLTGNMKYKDVVKETNMIPDTAAFKLYFCTLLIHHLDSRLADMISELADWVLPIHDAFIVSPNDARQVREWFAAGLRHMYKDRKEILNQFFKSIGIEKEFEEINDKELDVEQFSGYCLK